MREDCHNIEEDDSELQAKLKTTNLGKLRRWGTLDPEVSRHPPEESGTTQQPYIRGGQKHIPNEKPSNLPPENANLMSVGSVALIPSAAISQNRRDTPAPTQNPSSPT